MKCRICHFIVAKRQKNVLSILLLEKKNKLAYFLQQMFLFKLAYSFLHRFELFDVDYLY